MRIIIGMSGASGAVLGVRFLQALQYVEACETHLVVSEGAEQTIRLETGFALSDVTGMADVTHDIHDMAATIASGSFKTDGMIVAPCSMKTLSAVATGFAYNLLIRAVDVCLKEQRKVILLPREMPFNTIHLQNMQAAAQHGCMIMPPMLTFYNHPATIDEMVNHVVGKTLMQFDIDLPDFKPWEGVEEPSAYNRVGGVNIMQTYSFSEGAGDKQVNAAVVLVGDDVVVTIGGGTRPHIGAVAVAIFHPKIKDPSRFESTATVVTVPGHKEDQLARGTALMLAKALHTTVTVSVGIHIDDASADDIAELMAQTHRLTERIIEGLKKRVMTQECIDDALLEGNLPAVTASMGRYFAITGVVEMGKQLGRQLGFPTANVHVEPGQLLPPVGGYATLVWHGDQRYMAATNVGKCPTVGGERLTVEAHLLDFEGDLYDEVLRVEFVERLGDEHTFSELDTLIAYIQDSVDRTRMILAAYK